MDREDYVEAVLATVERVPRGRVTTYGAVAEFIGSGGPRQVGAVMARYGGPVPWWRVVHADGRMKGTAGADEQRARLAEEGVPLTGDGRVDWARAGGPWAP